MALNFPSSPSEGQVYSGYVFSGGLWKPAPIRTALPFNYFVNPTMLVSTEWFNTAGSVSARYGADQFVTHYSGTAVLTSQRVQVMTPKGSPNRYRVTVATADAALAATDYGYIGQIIEGHRVADFLWGSAAANQAIWRFGFKGPAGTYAASIRNGTAARSYVSLFTISAGQANIDTEQSLVIPGDTTGTWAKDAAAGFSMAITLATGTTFQAANNAWSAGNFLGAAGSSNGIGTAAAVFEMFDFGLYRDPYLTGKAPPWECRDEWRHIMECWRYYSIAYSSQGIATGGTTYGRAGSAHMVQHRATPAVTENGAWSFTLALSGVVTSITGGYSNTYASETDGILSPTTTAFTAGHGLAVQGGIISSSRM